MDSSFLHFDKDNLYCLNLVSEMKLAEVANTIGHDEAALNEPPHLDLTCFHDVFEFSV